MNLSFLKLILLPVLLCCGPLLAASSPTGEATPSASEQQADISAADALRAKKQQQLAELKDEDITPSMLELAKLEVTSAKITLNSLQLDLQLVDKSLKDLLAKQAADTAAQADAQPTGSSPASAQETAADNSRLTEQLVKLQAERQGLQRQIKEQQRKIKVLEEWSAALKRHYDNYQNITHLAKWEQEKHTLTQQREELLLKTSKLREKLAKIPPDENLEQQKELRLQILLNEEKAALINQTIQLHDAEERVRDLIQQSQSPDLPASTLSQLLVSSEAFLPQLFTLRDLMQKKQQLLALYTESDSVLSAREREKVQQLGEEYTQHLNRLNNLLEQAQSHMEALSSRIRESQQRTLSTRYDWPGSTAEWVTVLTELRHAPGQLLEQIGKIGQQISRRQSGTVLNALVFLTFWFIAYIVIHLWLKNKGDVINRNEASYTRWMSAFIRKLTQQNLLSIFTLVGLPVVMQLLGIEFRQYSVFFMLFLVFAVAKPALTLNRLLYEQQSTGIEWYDRQLYEGLKVSILLGAVLVTITVLTHHLEVSAITRETFDRLLMLAILVASVVVLWRRSSILEVFHKVLEERPRIFFVVQLVALLFPAAGAITGAIGLVGYTNLSWLLAYHEGVILMVIVTSLIVRGYMLDFYSWWYSRSVRRMPHGWMWAEAVVKPLELISRILLLVVAVFATFRIFGWSKGSTVVEKLTEILNHELFHVAGTAITLSSIILLVVVSAFFYWSAKWSREFAYRWVFKKIEDHGIRNSLSVFTQYAVVLLGLYILLRVLGINLTALAVLAGAIGVGIGFGLQTIANNFISGILLLIERPFRTGDYVNIGSSEGWVTRIGIRSLTVRTRDNIEVIIPNTDTITSAFMNWTHMDNIVRFKKAVGVSYNADPHQVKDLIMAVLDEHPKIVEDPAPAVWLDAFGDSSVDFIVLFYIDMNRHERRQVISEVMFGIWDTLKENGIEIPFPQRDVHFRSGTPPVLLPSDSRPSGEQED